MILAFPCQQPSATPTLGTLSCEGLLLSARQSCHWAQPACSARSQPQEKQLWPCPPLSAPVLVATVFFDYSEHYCSSVWVCCCRLENTLLWVLSPSTTGQVRNTGPGFQLPGGSSVPPACGPTCLCPSRACAPQNHPCPLTLLPPPLLPPLPALFLPVLAHTNPKPSVSLLMQNQMFPC